DLAVADDFSNSVFLLLNQGGGQFASALSFPAGNKPESVALGDLDGDGTLDIATANDGSNSVSVLLNQGGGQFANALSFPAGNKPESVALGDLDGDGTLDIATGNLNVGSDNVSVLLNQGGAQFANALSFPV